MALPQSYGMLVAGLSAGAVGGLLTAWCAWLEYRVVMSERLACALALDVAPASRLDDAQLVFGVAPASQLEAPARLSSEEEDSGGGVWGRAEEPVYHSAAPDILAFDSPV